MTFDGGPCPMFTIGDRVEMVRHADWKTSATARVMSAGRQRKNSFGRLYVQYSIDFDEPQADLTDEMHGDFERRYTGTTVDQQFLRLLG
jgi:hypothetical protein